MIPAFLTAIPRRAWIAGGIVALILLAFTLHKCAVSDAGKRGEERGAVQQTAKNLEETVKRVETANEAREEIRNDRGNARYDQCLRTARTPANCERFLRVRKPDDRRTGS